ncbi:hypothetical protein O5D80_008643 [Batrachochytrium dendrobatidis]|nr:hypothetical protein O5D80_008643 [Batrachochytrium dendrobatidis]
MKPLIGWVASESPVVRSSLHDPNPNYIIVEELRLRFRYMLTTPKVEGVRHIYHRLVPAAIPNRTSWTGGPIGHLHTTIVWLKEDSPTNERVTIRPGGSGLRARWWRWNPHHSPSGTVALLRGASCRRSNRLTI